MRKILLVLVLLFNVFLLASCDDPNPKIEYPDVTLTIAGGWTECRAVDEIGRLFQIKYPNCTIEYENMQNYYDSVGKRLTGDSPIDLFFTVNVQNTSKEYIDNWDEVSSHLLDFYNCEGLDLSNTFQPLLDNFEYRGDDVNTKTIYGIPVGAEMRGLYVNKSLLNSLGIKIPTNQAELLAACETLKTHGYIPFQGNPGNFATLLMYPWIANQIANAVNYDETYNKVENRVEGVSEVFREPYEFMYTLVENNYYDYKTSQTDLNLFNKDSDETYAQHFFNIITKDKVLTKGEGYGQVAFMPHALSLKNLMDKTKEDYHSDIEYSFIPAPLGKNGGYVYLSPASAIAANKDSANLEWIIKFINFLFEPANNKVFNEYFDTMPNTKEVFSYVTSLYDVPTENISHLGQVTFSYDFYQIIKNNIVDVCKCNNPKYMDLVIVGEVDDPNDEIPDDDYYALKPLQTYLDKLESALKK